MNVIYISSLPHSGSTILDISLSNNKEIFSVGELGNIHLVLNKESPGDYSQKCACGADNLYSCPLWSKVLSDVSFKNFSKNNSSYNDMAFVNLHVKILKNISSNILEKFILDSSKSKERISFYIKLGANIQTIFLYRDPFGQINSLFKYHKSTYSLSKLFLYIIIYIFSNLKLCIGLIFSKKNYISLNYNYWSNNFIQSTNFIGESFGLNIHVNKNIILKKKNAHNVYGNNVKFKSEFTIKEDKTSSIDLPIVFKLFIMLTAYPFYLCLVLFMGKLRFKNKTLS